MPILFTYDTIPIADDSTPTYPVCPACLTSCPREAEDGDGICECLERRCRACGSGYDPCPTCTALCDGCRCAEHYCAGCGNGADPCASCSCLCQGCECRYGECYRCDCDHTPRVLVNSYSTRAERRLSFQGKPTDPYEWVTGTQMRDTTFFGVELEVEVGRGTDYDDAAQKTLDLIGKDFVLLKHDGSLSNGFEIVSAPATLEEHRQHWMPFLTNKPRGISSWNTSTCGMHVHISRPRDGRDSLHVGKMLVFLNDTRHREQIVAIAGRNSRWGSFDGSKTVAGGLSSFDLPDPMNRGRLRPRYGRGGDRYSALNLTNQHTVEIRMFKGTTSPDAFMKNLEFCHAFFYFTRDSSIREMSWEKFVEYVRANRSLYPALLAFIEECIERDEGMARRVQAIKNRGLDPDQIIRSKIVGDAAGDRVKRKIQSMHLKASIKTTESLAVAS